jgi:hypothetical protein
MFTPFAFVKQAAGGGGGGFGPLTTAFLAATGISDATIETALNDFETGLATYSLTTSNFDAIYPLVGGTSDTCKYNFIDTSLYTLSYTGSLSFNSDGMQAAGSPKDGSAGTVSFTQISSASYCSYYYVTDYVANASSFESPIGAAPDYTGTGNLVQYYLQWNGATQLVHPCNVDTAAGNGSINSGYTQMAGNGSYALSRISTGDLRAYVGGSQSGATNTTVLTNRAYTNGPNTPLHLLSRQANSTTTTQSRLGWASVGPGLDSTQMSNYNTLVVAFQTALSRQ